MHRRNAELHEQLGGRDLQARAVAAPAVGEIAGGCPARPNQRREGVAWHLRSHGRSAGEGACHGIAYARLHASAATARATARSNAGGFVMNVLPTFCMTAWMIIRFSIRRNCPRPRLLRPCNEPCRAQVE